MLSNKKITTGLGDKLYSLYNIVSLNPRRILILTSTTKQVIGPCGDFSKIDPRVLNLLWFEMYNPLQWNVLYQ